MCKVLIPFLCLRVMDTPWMIQGCQQWRPRVMQGRENQICESFWDLNLCKIVKPWVAQSHERARPQVLALQGHETPSCVRHQVEQEGCKTPTGTKSWDPECCKVVRPWVVQGCETQRLSFSLNNLCNFSWLENSNK